MDSTKKSSEYLDKFDNSSNDFSIVESNFLSIEPEEETSCEDFVKFENSSTNVDVPALVSNLPSIETEEEKSCENFDKSENRSNVDFPALLSNLPDFEEEKSDEDFEKSQNSGGDNYPALISKFSSIELDKCENTSNDFPELALNLPSRDPEDEKSYEDNFDKSENIIVNDEFPALVSTFPSIKPKEATKSVTITQEAPKFSYATMLAKKASTCPSAILAKKVVCRVGPSDTESRPRTGPNIIVGPKEKVVCVRGLPKKLEVVELIQALKKFGPVKLDSLQIKRSAFGSCSGTLEFQTHDSARAAVEAGKIKFGEHVGFVSFRSMSWNRG